MWVGSQPNKCPRVPRFPVSGKGLDFALILPLKEQSLLWTTFPVLTPSTERIWKNKTISTHVQKPSTKKKKLHFYPENKFPSHPYQPHQYHRWLLGPSSHLCLIQQVCSREANSTLTSNHTLSQGEISRKMQRWLYISFNGQTILGRKFSLGITVICDKFCFFFLLFPISSSE